MPAPQPMEYPTLELSIGGNRLRVFLTDAYTGKVTIQRGYRYGDNPYEGSFEIVDHNDGNGLAPVIKSATVCRTTHKGLVEVLRTGFEPGQIGLDVIAHAMVAIKAWAATDESAAARAQARQIRLFNSLLFERGHIADLEEQADRLRQEMHTRYEKIEALQGEPHKFLGDLEYCAICEAARSEHP